jgi:hypothetical protein
VHAAGSPHFLTDPLNGLSVAALIRDKLLGLRPDQQSSFEQCCQAFRQRLGAAMVGETLAKKHDFEKLALLYEYNRLGDLFKQLGDDGKLDGWLGFGATVAGFMEPKA